MYSLPEENFKVVIRARPLNQKQKDQINTYQQAYLKKMKNPNGRMMKLSPSAYTFYTKFYNSSASSIIKVDRVSNKIMIADPQYKNSDRKMKPYSYSKVYNVEDRSSTIFSESLQDHVQSVLKGYNCTILAYGITGSGKTFTIFGPNKDKQDYGISFLTFQYLLREKKRLLKEQQTKVNYKFSFIEIYNENVRDLLSSDNNRYLNIVEDNKGNTTISDLTQVQIGKFQEIFHYINVGTAKRVFASTSANQYSSRSHAILQMSVEIEKSNSQKFSSKLFIIDLAGSEKLQSLNSSKKVQEGANINRSLLALGNCINTLAQNSRRNIVSHIPYRDSKLTRMLKDSLGGNARTIMVACITPNPFLIDQTITTLNYASRAQGIQKKIMRNLNEDDINEDLLCLKCKKQISYGESEQKEESEIKMKINEKADLFEQLYEDILQNIRESEKIKTFGRSNASNNPQWHKLQVINEEQRLKLKQIMFALTVKDQKGEKTDKKMKKVLEDEDKENDIKKSRSSFQSLTNSKSRRRKSHNKFEVVKRVNSMQKQKDRVVFD